MVRLEMKLAVIGGGSTYTPELVAGLARERERLDLRELVLHDIDARTPRAVVGGLATRMLDAAGYDGSLSVTDDLDAALDGRRVRARPTARRRPGGTPLRRDDPARLRLHRAGDDGRRRSREGAANRPGRARDRRPRTRARATETRGSSTSRTRSGSSRARSSTPATARSVSAMSLSASSDSSPGCWTSTPRRVLVDQVGLNHLTWVRAVRLDGSRHPPRAAAGARRRARRASAASRARCSRSSASSRPYYLRYFYFHDEVLDEQRTGIPRAATVAEIERELLELYRDPALVDEAASARAARWRVSTARRRRSSLRHCATGRRRRPGCRRAKQRDVGRLGRRRRRRGPCTHRRERRDAAATAAARARAARAHAARRSLRAAGGRGRRSAATATLVHKALLAHPLIGQVPQADELVESLLSDGAEHLPRFHREALA